MVETFLGRLYEGKLCEVQEIPYLHSSSLEFYLWQGYHGEEGDHSPRSGDVLDVCHELLTEQSCVYILRLPWVEQEMCSPPRIIKYILDTYFEFTKRKCSVSYRHNLLISIR